MQDFGPAFLVFAVVGYFTVRNIANRTRFRAAAIQWERNVFESAALGFTLFLVVRLLAAPFVAALAPVPILGRGIALGVRLVGKYLPFPFAGSLIATAALGCGGALLSNLWWRAEEEVRRAIRDHGGELRAFLHDIAGRGAPVSLTMKNRKVYVGLVMVAPGLQEPSHVTLLPTLSGYRDEHTLRLVFTTRYEHVYEDLEKRQLSGEELAIDIESFVIILPLENIDSANQFDDDAYARYFAGAAVPGAAPTPAVEELPQSTEAAKTARPTS